MVGYIESIKAAHDHATERLVARCQQSFCSAAILADYFCLVLPTSVGRNRYL